MRSGDQDGYDAIVISPHKFMGGPGTPGILLMNQNLYLLKNSPPSTCGGGTVCFVNGFSEKDTLYYDDIEEREDAGTPAIVQKIRCAMSFWVKEFIGYSVIEQRESFFIDIAMRRLLQNPNIWILGNTTVKREPILSFLVYTRELEDNYSSEQLSKMSLGKAGKPLPVKPRHVWRERTTRRGKPLHGRFVVKLLNDLFGIQARGGCACAGPYGHILLNVDKEQSLAFRSAIKKGYNGLKPGWSRLSFSYYMSDEEFDYILSSIEFIAMYGPRFLPLYDFDWKTGDWNFKKSLTSGVQSFVFPKKLISSSFNSEDDQELELSRTSSQQDKYVYYLEIARAFAKSLNKYPEERTIPENIDLDLLLFRV